MSECQSSQLRLTSKQSTALTAFLAGRGMTCEVKPVDDAKAGSDALTFIVVFPDAAAASVAEWQRLPTSNA